ncbi:MAG: hypothetical protein HYX66_02460 [Ignavibacteria bacterium]|nr:hypothetical protein [Ignavibacteria bacterium]
MIAAGIDIGTNTILMVIGRNEGNANNIDEWEILADEQRFPRLGEGLSVNGLISGAALLRASCVLEEYKMLLSEYGVERCRAVATASLRNALNATEVQMQLQTSLGKSVEIIDGITEGTLTFQGSITFSSHDSILLDIGGGSTEFVRGSYGVVGSVKSIDIGVVNLTNKYVVKRPLHDDLIQEIRNDVYLKLHEHIPELYRTGTRLVGVAGTATALAMINIGAKSYNSSEISRVVLIDSVVHTLSERLLRSSLDELHKLEGIDEMRADVLPMGSLILDESMKFLKAHECQVSTRGLRFGVLLTA